MSNPDQIEVMSSEGDDSPATGQSQQPPINANVVVENPSSESQGEDREKFVKNKRRYLRGKITRAINRLKQGIEGQQSSRRLNKEIQDIRVDYAHILELHGELYNFVDGDETANLDEWENILVNDIYSIEESVEDYVKSHREQSKQGVVTRSHSVSARTGEQLPNPQPAPTVSIEQPQGPGERTAVQQTVSSNSEQSFDLLSSDYAAAVQPNMSVPDETQRQTVVSPETVVNMSRQSFDIWIDELIEFKETQLIPSVNNLSIADALFRLEASRDLPTVEIPKFNGDALDYVEFVERFRIHVHNKPYLTDDVRMSQLKSHVKGEAEKAISGLGSAGTMYPTALKTLKQQFGQPSVIARACINKLTKGCVIHANDRQSLRDLSVDIINARAMFMQMNYFADVNANDNLRQIIKRLPDHMIRAWKVKVTEIREHGEQPTIDHIGDFVRKRVQAEFDPDFGNLETNYTRGQKSEFKGQNVRRGVHAASRSKQRKLECFVCKENHRVVNCPVFEELSVDKRVEKVKELRLCFSCLTKGHMTRDCRSKGKCNKNDCSRTHHPLLHTDVQSVSGTSPLDKGSIMPVVRVLFRSANGKTQEGNVLVDSGAGTTIIRRGFAKLLGLQGKREGLSLAVVGGEQVDQPYSRRLKVWISPLQGGEEHLIEAHELDKTIISIPALDRPWLRKFPHLSDLEYSHKAGPVDLILGVHYSHLHAEIEIRQGLPFQPVAKRTALGWYVIGSNNDSSTQVCAINFVQRIDMQKFYDFETLGIQAPNCNCPRAAMSRDDKQALDLMEASCVKIGQRYSIGLPWKKSPEQLPDNYSVALKRLESLEKSLLKNPVKGNMYKAAISEYERNEWSCPVTEEELDIHPVHYLPHHGVYRPEKISTPLRIVFDPATPYQGVTLNSLLHKGPGLIGNLLGVMLRFREDRVAIAGDISKMYLQILLPESDTHLHRYLWRDLDVTQEPKIYRLLRVTFGAKSSPDMASYVLLRIADEHKNSQPDVTAILQRDRYMDDILHSCPTEEIAISRMKALEEALCTGSFTVKEWFTSLQTIKQTAKPSNTDDSALVNLDGQEVKTLGVVWNPESDKLKFAVKQLQPDKFTKRTILSKMSTVYDPLGLASCVTIKARVAMQDIWRQREYDWDDALPNNMIQLWKELFQDIESLRSIEFPRCLKPEEAYGKPDLHVFSDASKSAYGAVAYLLWNTAKGPEINLVSAKARVAPLHHSTIPRLELMAAVIASRLAKTIAEEFIQKPANVTLWTDAQIVLHWLRSESIAMKPFVGVRVAEVQTTWGPEHWKFVPTELNPADDISRGISAIEMNGRWMHGPEFLRDEPHKWPREPQQLVEDNTEYKKVKQICFVQNTKPFIDLEKYSDWNKLLRVTAFCRRFITNCRSKSQIKPLQGTLQCEEVEESKRYWIQIAQQDLQDWKSRFPELSPFIQDEIVRVGGRLKQTKLSYDQRHPVLLPADNHVSKLIMKNVHDRSCHGGAERTLGDSRREFWIIRGRKLAKDIVHKCVTCRKLRQPAHTTLMGDLPSDRVKPYEPPFSVTGVDLFGPFLLRYGRNKKSKAWGAIFTCATTRAIHLEIVNGLSTEAFLHALRRFTAHHGWPHTIISDNGTSFVGTRKELKTLVTEGRKQIEDFATLHEVKWKFITPLSPHQGGFYESLIKQVKRALQVSVGEQVLPWDEMSTVFAEVESLVNSRPIGFAPNNPNDLQPLTPNHFILGRATTSVPQGPFQETRNLRKRFEFVQTLVHSFWKRFVRDYVPTLIKRSKWQQKGRQLQVDDVVLLIEPNVARGKWNLARVIEVYKGADGIVRNVKVRTQYGEYKRSVQKCCLILEQD